MIIPVFLIETDKLILTFICKYEDPRILKKKNKVGGLLQCDYRTQ